MNNDVDTFQDNSIKGPEKEKPGINFEEEIG